MFKYSCYIENSKEAREWLEKIGIAHNPFDSELASNSWIIVNNGMYILIDTIPEENLENFYKEDVNCLGNLPLFKALTAVRNDSDYMQWFTDGKSWVMLGRPKVMLRGDLYLDNYGVVRKTTVHSNIYWSLMQSCKKIIKHEGMRAGYKFDSFHKATKEELIKHFKK